MGSQGSQGVAGEKETKPELNGEVKKTKTIPVKGKTPQKQ